MNAKTTATMVIALVAMIGMTGLAMAGSTMDYDVDFTGVGTGSVVINTFSPVGTDYQSATWTNCVAGGHQDANYNGGTWLRVNRDTTVTGIQNGQAASGTILTQSKPTTPVTDPSKAAIVQTTATYADGNAFGSHVTLVQDVRLYDSDMPVVNDAGNEKAYVNTEINGFAYGAGSQLSGDVMMITDGSLTAATRIFVILNDGHLDMDAQARITDDTTDSESARVIYDIAVTSPGDTSDGIIQGTSDVNGVVQGAYTATFTNADTFATGYFYAVTI